MRFLELELRRFGPFSDVTLDLAPGGLHLIYGSNEAGKSTALRAVLGLLFGIPERTRDDHVHRGPELRISARLERSDGERIHVVRRKGRKGTLLNAAEEPVDESLLDPFLGGVGRELFEHMFGLGHAALVRGGRELLEGRGELGESLFGAGGGLRGIHALRRRLRAEADEIFTRHARQRRLNQALQQFQQARQRVRELSVQPRQWKELRDRLAEAEARFDELGGRAGELSAEVARLERVSRTAGPVRRRAELRRMLAELGEAGSIPERCRERREDAERRRESAAEAEAKRRSDVDRCREALEGLDVPEALLDRKAAVDDLRDRRGAYVKALSDRVKLEQEAEAHREEARAILREMGRSESLEDAEALRIPSAERKKIRSLGRERERLDAARAGAERDAAAAEARIGEIEARLSGLPAPRDGAPLRRAVQAARRAGDLDEGLRALEREVAGLDRQARDRLAALPLYEGPLEELVRLPVPPPESIDRFEARFEALALRARRLEDRRAAAPQARMRIDTELRALETHGRVPTEAERDRARAARDAQWRRVRGVWLDAEPSGTEPSELARAYEETVQRADAAADHLWTDAERAAKASALRSEAAQCERELREIGGEQEQLRGERQNVEEGWRALWRAAGIDPFPPREMRTWLVQHDKLATRVAQLEARRRERDRGLRTREGLRSLIVEALHALGESEPSKAIPGEPAPARRPHAETAAGGEALGEIALDGGASRGSSLSEDHELARAQTPRAAVARGRTAQPGMARDGAAPEAATLAPLLDRSEETLRAIESAEQMRAQLDESLREARRDGERAARELARCRSALEEWSKRWGEALSARGLPPAASTEEVEALLESTARLFAKLEDERKLRLRIEHIDRDAERFRSDLRALAAELAPDLAGEPAEAAAAALASRCEEALRARERREQLQERIARSQAERDEARRTREAAEETLRQLCEAAGCDTLDELRDAERRWRERSDALEKIRALETQLDGEGLPLDALISQAEGADLDALPPELERLRGRREALSVERAELKEQIGSLKRDLYAMDGGAAAAEASDEAEAALAEVASLAKTWTRMRIAARVLGLEIERYRETHQGPVLRRAAELLEKMTCGDLAGLRAGLDDDGEAVIHCVRRDGREVRVEELSDGTRDQLYLSLRLASLEQRAERSEPLPLIVDDVLVNFDDRRAEATLALLGELSDRTQILFFTHHARLRDLARRAVPARRLKHHDLDAARDLHSAARLSPSR